jgi:glycosyltransferase involved in cell wall biosynthesis
MVSVVIPCRNEAGHIVRCLDSIITGDYPADRLEILVVDGLSEDGTPERVRGYAGGKPQVRLLSNHQRITPSALNIGITAARGTIIVRIDAHSSVAPDYIRQCVTALHRHSADNVGGVMHTVPSNNTPAGRAIALSLSHPFGVGNSVFRTHRAEACEVDTVFGGCFPKAVFDKVGLYNEKLPRGQDMEFNLRLRRAGGRVVFVPEIVSHYFSRSTYRGFVRHNWINGIWAILPFAFSDIVPIRPRHLVPLAFVLGLAGLIVLSTVMPVARWLLVLVVAAYSLTAIAAALTVAWKRRDPSAAAYLPVMFATLHLCYGAGSFVGATQLMFQPQFWHRMTHGRKYQPAATTRASEERPTR